MRNTNTIHQCHEYYHRHRDKYDNRHPGLQKRHAMAFSGPMLQERQGSANIPPALVGVPAASIAAACNIIITVPVTRTVSGTVTISTTTTVRTTTTEVVTETCIPVGSPCVPQQDNLYNLCCQPSDLPAILCLEERLGVRKCTEST